MFIMFYFIILTLNTFMVLRRPHLKVTSDVHLTKNEFMPLYAIWWLLLILCRPVYATV